MCLILFNLKVTPLTDRIYITATQACANNALHAYKWLMCLILFRW